MAVQKKVCMLGSFAVGKTSLVRRYVHSVFDEKYHTTLGVKVDKKVVPVGDTEVAMVLWDLAGEDDAAQIRTSYLRGTAGYLLVCDSTRRSTFDTALETHDFVLRELGALPFVFVINKTDLESEFDLDETGIAQLQDRGVRVLRTSARTGTGVDDAFTDLARSMLGGD